MLHRLHAVWSAIGYCRPSDRLWRCALWLNDVSYGKSVWKVNRKCPLWTRFYNFQPNTPSLAAAASQTLPSPSKKIKNTNFTYSFYLAYLIRWPFCLCSLEHGRLLSLRWSLINVSYAVRSALSATVGLLVFFAFLTLITSQIFFYIVIYLSSAVLLLSSFFICRIKTT